MGEKMTSMTKFTTALQYDDEEDTLFEEIPRRSSLKRKRVIDEENLSIDVIIVLKICFIGSARLLGPGIMSRSNSTLSGSK